MGLTTCKMKMAAIISCGRDYAALEKSLDMALQANITSVFLFGGNALKRYEIPPRALELLELITVCGDGAVFYNADAPETLVKVEAYLREAEADVWFFLNAGDTFHELYPSYLTRFFSSSRGKCGVVYVPVLTDGIGASLAEDDPRLPVEFCDLPKSGLLSYTEDYERFPQNDVFNGAAVLAEDALAAGLDFEKGAGAFSDLVEWVARDKGMFGRLNMTYMARTVAKDTNVSTSTKVTNGRKYLVSCIVLVTPDGDSAYLVEAIESVLEQSVGFENNIQLILISGSNDDINNEVCDSYMGKYPDNIIYLQQERLDVSTARNAGIGIANGEFIVFLHGNDKYDSLYFERAIECLEKRPQASFAASRLMLDTAGQVKDGALYSKSRTVNISKAYSSVQLSTKNIMIRRSALDEIRFEPLFEEGIDVAFMHQLTLQNDSYAISSSSFVLARRVKNDKDIDYEWSNNLLDLCLVLINQSTKPGKIKQVSRYTQYTLMRLLQWCNVEIVRGIDEKTSAVDALLEKIKCILSVIEVDIIMSFKSFSQPKLLLLLRLKGCDIYSDTSDTNNKLCIRIDQKPLFNMNAIININTIEEYDGIIHIACTFKMPYLEKYSLFVYYGSSENNLFRLTPIDTDHAADVLLGCSLQKVNNFIADIPYTGEGQIKFYLEIKGLGEIPAELVYGSTSRICNKEGSFVIGGKTIIRRMEANNALYCEDFSIEKLTMIVGEYVSKNFSGNLYTEAVLLLKEYIRSYTTLKRRKIWLFMDRPEKADDNAEHLYRFCQDVNDDIERYFILSETSASYADLSQKYKNIIAYGSQLHKLLYLFADVYVCSNVYQNPFKNDFEWALFSGLCKGKLVYVRHGISTFNAAKFLSSWVRNVKMFVTASEAERHDIVNNSQYGYSKDFVKLTGLPRYDNLFDAEEKKYIAFMPSWRKELFPQGAFSKYNPDFKKSEYVMAISALLTNDDLISAIIEKGYKLLFFPHPNVYKQIDEIDIDARVLVADYETSYQSVIAESALLITDNSSVAFDFAYLRKPVMYFNFSNSIYKPQPIDLVNGGFGEVVTDISGVMETISKYLKNNFKVKAVYSDRAKKYFAYFDKNNCKRVYDAIIEMTGHKAI